MARTSRQQIEKKVSKSFPVTSNFDCDYTWIQTLCFRRFIHSYFVLFIVFLNLISLYWHMGNIKRLLWICSGKPGFLDVCGFCFIAGRAYTKGHQINYLSSTSLFVDLNGFLLMQFSSQQSQVTIWCPKLCTKSVRCEVCV